MTRGLAEMSRLGAKLGANPLTFMGLAGVGDLIATCTSRHSRNRGLGEHIARGGSIDSYTAETHMVAEGAFSCMSVDDLAHREGLELPITHQVRAILYEGASPLSGTEALMVARPKTSCTVASSWTRRPRWTGRILMAPSILSATSPVLARLSQ